uniref:Uncharacterized protein n=1 Tax=Zea mays TaxID=4577 RepID=C0PMR7_MAIZE|nr:unknown [Zea mays]
MPPLPAADDLLILEFIASNRRIPHAVFNSFIASQSPPSAFSRTSQRLRKALVLRALDAALYTVGASCSSGLLLHKARKVLADPDAAACFPHQIPFTENEENDEARAAVADLKRLLDLEWANLPPSTLELVAGDGSHQTGAAADHTMRTKLRLFAKREILAKPVQVGSASHQSIRTQVADNASNANKADGARRDEAHPSNSNVNYEADSDRESMVGHQNASVKGAEGQLSEKSVFTSKKRVLVERIPKWDSSDDDQPVRKRKLDPFERKPYPSPTCAYKIRKKWSKIEIETLLEGVDKYGIGNWKDIKLAYPGVFEERSTVDLKDKFRNLGKRHHESS